jgi:hypothetical protein
VTVPTYVTPEVTEAISVGAGIDADAVLRVLDVAASLGLLVEDAAAEHDITDEDLAATAQWLAGLSEHPRYGANGYGWQALLESEHNVDHAHSEALAHVGDPAMRSSIDGARTILRDAIERHRRASVEGQ